jgi:hypothetical protein
MVTTIQVSEELKELLESKKIYDKETYEEVIWDMHEDTLALSEETKKNIAISREQYERGEIVSFTEIKKRIGK